AGRPDAVLVLDLSAFPKSGANSCGVARQRCGRLGDCVASLVRGRGQLRAEEEPGARPCLDPGAGGRRDPGERRQERLLERLARAELHFALDNDRFLVASFVAHLRNYLARLGLCDETAMTRVCIALEEALLNAIFHGNLELSSDLRQEGEEAYYRLA